MLFVCRQVGYQKKTCPVCDFRDYIFLSTVYLLMKKLNYGNFQPIDDVRDIFYGRILLFLLS